MRSVKLMAVASAVLLLGGQSSSEAEAIAAAKSAVVYRLTDPDSANFRKVREIPAKNDWGPVICGEVNAKNQYGGYVGFTKFMYVPSTGEVMFSQGRGDTPGSWC